MSRRFATTARWLGLLALCLGMITALIPSAIAAATPGGMLGWGGDDNGSLCLGRGRFLTHRLPSQRWASTRLGERISSGRAA